MMVGDILSAISLGRKLVATISDLRRDVQAVRAGPPARDIHAGRFEALENRLDDLETKARDQHARAVGLEQSLNDVLRATEALANRVSTIFWIACTACGLGLAGLIVAIVALVRTIR
jgi:hypothetical protein